MNNKIALIGWYVAAALIGIMVGSGFQGNNEKMGVVDLRRVIMESKINQTMTDKVEAERKSRLAVLDFIDQHRVITAAQAQRIRELELKDPKTDAEKTELDGLKQTVTAATKEYETINTKGKDQLTDDDRKKINDYALLFQGSAKILQSWSQEFDQQFSQIRDQAERDAIDLAQKAASAVAKKQGYTITFSSTAVAYAANDITADTIKEASK